MSVNKESEYSKQTNVFWWENTDLLHPTFSDHCNPLLVTPEEREEAKRKDKSDVDKKNICIGKLVFLVCFRIVIKWVTSKKTTKAILTKKKQKNFYKL